jgi:hypothetical protein
MDNYPRLFTHIRTHCHPYGRANDDAERIPPHAFSTPRHPRNERPRAAAKYLLHPTTRRSSSRREEGKNISLSRWWCCRRRRGGIFVIVCGPAMAVISFPIPPHAFSSGFHFIHDDDLLLLSLRAPSPLTWRPPHGKKIFQIFSPPLLPLSPSPPAGLLAQRTPTLLRSAPFHSAPLLAAAIECLPT